MKTLLKILAFTAVVLVLAAIFLPGRIIGSGMPDLDAMLSHPSLLGEVTVTRDEWGVPHIKAEYATDAYFAYGYTVAQDRLFQLEILRRLGRGELAEIVGEPGLGIDKISRTLLWRKTAERLLADESQYDPEFVAANDAFITGLNHFIATNKAPIEYKVLGFEPKPFTKEDSYALLGYMAYGFADGIRSDSLHAILQARIADKDVDLLFPGYSRQRPVTVMEGIGEERGPQARSANALRPETYAGLETLASMLEAPIQGYGAFHGSNSWVLGPSRSKSGGALLANDPHIGFTNPAVWYECQMSYPGFELYGVHLPLIPFPVIGHSPNKGWTMTMFENDDLDLFRETFNPDNPKEVMYKGEWAPVEEWTETIQVKGADPVELTVRVTPHGPIVTDMIDGYDGDPVSAWWLFHQVDASSVQAFYDLGKAKTMDESRDAVSHIIAPGLNISYTDKEGNIAWWAAARLPHRPAHVNSQTILDGASGADEPLGMLPFSDNPQLENPPRGVIVTSNNMSTTGPVGPLAELEGYWQPADRAWRIEELLAQQDTWSLDELKAVQFDNKLITGDRVTDAVLTALADSADALQGAPRAAYDALKDWDYGHTTDSVGASVHRYVYDALMDAILLDELGETNLATYQKIGNSRNFITYVVRDLGNPYYDNIDTKEVESAADIFRQAFADGVETLVSQHGTDPKGWEWGKVHTVEYPYLILGNVDMFKRWWSIGPFPAQGTNESVAKMSWRSDRYKVEHGASMRLLLDYSDYGNTENMWFILPTGNSGHVMSPHYDDQAQMYLQGEYRSIHTRPEDIEKSAQHVTHMSPVSPK
jgi:penicillin G amidase